MYQKKPKLNKILALSFFCAIFFSYQTTSHADDNSNVKYSSDPALESIKKHFYELYKAEHPETQTALSADNKSLNKKDISVTEALLSDTTGVNNKKHSFVEKLLDFKILDQEISIRPYLGASYALNATSYLNAKFQGYNPGSSAYTNPYYQPATSVSANSALPQLFNQFGGIIGFMINDKYLFEFSGQGGLNSTTNADWTNLSGDNNYPGVFTSNVSSNMNTFRFTFGYVLDKEIFGQYGDKNKLILLAGLAVGVYNSSYIETVSSNYIKSNFATTSYSTTSIIVVPEIGLAYQRYIIDHLSLRLDARVNTLGLNGSAINGTFMASMLFHI